MKELSKYKLNKISKNLDYFFNIATKQDIKSGLNWYNEANKEASIIAKKYKLDKTFNFVNNIAYLDNGFLTIDIWHLRACFFNDIKIDSTTIGKLAYQQIKVLTINKANKLGLKGFELQAIVWLSAQKIFINNRKTR